jgi:hypothetical protein
MQTVVVMIKLATVGRSSLALHFGGCIFFIDLAMVGGFRLVP